MFDVFLVIDDMVMFAYFISIQFLCIILIQSVLM